MYKQKKIFNMISKKSFHKSDVQIKDSDWLGSDSFWSQEGEKVFTTEVGTDPGMILIRYVEALVTGTNTQLSLTFPNSSEWNAGSVVVNSGYATITRREVHMFDKLGIFPLKFRIDTFNGTTLLSQYYVHRDLSDPRIFKYGIRIRHHVTPSSFILAYDMSDDAHFKEFGIVIPTDVSSSITDPAQVVGKTYLFSIPTAYLPEGRSLLGGSNDSNARVMAFAAFLIATLAIIYVIYYTPTSKPQ